MVGGGGGFRFVRKNPGLLLTTLGFLRDEPGLLDFENKRNLLRTLLANPDLATRAALDVMASVSAAPSWRRGGVGRKRGGVFGRECACAAYCRSPLVVLKHDVLMLRACSGKNVLRLPICFSMLVLYRVL